MGREPAANGPMHVIRKKPPAHDANHQSREQPANRPPGSAPGILNAFNHAAKVESPEMIFLIVLLLRLSEPLSILFYRKPILFKGLFHTLPRAAVVHNLRYAMGTERHIGYLPEERRKNHGSGTKYPDEAKAGRE